jgi:formylglycine-generating enzyme required for sulfatase activity
MKLTSAAAALMLCQFLLVADDAPVPTNPAAAPGATASASSTNPAPAIAPLGTTNKISIKDLMKEQSFTNSTGMVMVKISSILWAGKYEVTQEEYQKVAGANPSQFRGDRNPVDSVSYNDALGFCGQLIEAEAKEKMLPEGFKYTLPTQDQWHALMDSASLADGVISQGAPRSGTAPVGSLGPNSLGLYDTRGNVMEWCLDPEDKPYRVLLGGAWDTSIEVNLRPEFRVYSKGPDDKQNDFGFRCVMVSGGTVSSQPQEKQEP